MNRTETFRRLVTNQYMPYYDYDDYAENKFSFQTVFYVTPCSYCCCECAFEHEYLEYISSNGEIDEQMYNKIVQSIISGKCPHVDKVCDKYIRETSINAIHIAAAVGTERAIKYYLEDYEDLTEGIFNLSPFRMAVLRGNASIIRLIVDAIPHLWEDEYTFEEKLIYTHKTETNKPQVRVERMPVPYFCVSNKEKQVLQSVLAAVVEYSGINKALEYTFEHELEDVQWDLLKYVRSYDHFRSLHNCALSAIVYDQPHALHNILQTVYNKGLCRSDSNMKTLCLENNNMSKFYPVYLSIICGVLKRPDCETIATRFMYKCNCKCTNDDNLDLLAMSLDILRDNFNNYNAEIREKFKGIRQIQEAINFSYEKNMGRLHRCVGQYPEEVKFLLEMGADVDSVDYRGETAMVRLLSKPNLAQTFRTLRESIELLLGYNPSTVLSQNVVKLAIDVDEYFAERTLQIIEPGEYTLNSKMHPLVTIAGEEDNVLIYCGPLLMECGFPVDRNTLLAAFGKRLSDTEYDYIRRYLKSPRSLLLSCRDVIRRHYKQRQLHLFVRSLAVPKKIKDFILLNCYFKHQL